MNRRGFALIATLWVITVLSGVVGMGVAGIRIGQRANLNRTVLVRGRWAAEACTAIAFARWRDSIPPLPETVDLGRGVRCSWRVTDPAARLNVNNVSRDQLEGLFKDLGLTPDSVTALSSSILSAAAVGDLWDLGRISSFPGFDAQVLEYLTVDGPGKVNVTVAPKPVLDALPGMSGEAVQVLLSNRRSMEPIANMEALNDALTPAAQGVLEEERRELTMAVTFQSTQFVLLAEGWVETYGAYPRATIESLVAPLPDRVAVLRRRMW